jgi:hypothetical protein
MRTLPHVHDARWIDLGEGQSIEGVVRRLPAPGIHSGTRLFLRTDDGEVLSIAVAAKRGWSVLEWALKRERVRVGDRITVEFLGWRQTADKERRYRDVDVTVLDRPLEQAA